MSRTGSGDLVGAGASMVLDVSLHLFSFFHKIL